MTNQPTPRDRVKVKALEWSFNPAHDEYESMFYSVFEYEGRWEVSLMLHSNDDVFPDPYPTLSAAQAACQAHYEQTIYDLLEVR